MWQTYRKSNLRLFMQPSSPEVIILFPDTKEVVHAAHEHATTRLLSSHLSYLLSAATSIPSPNKPIIIPTAHISITLPPFITPIYYNPFHIHISIMPLPITYPPYPYLHSSYACTHTTHQAHSTFLISTLNLHYLSCQPIARFLCIVHGL